MYSPEDVEHAELLDGIDWLVIKDNGIVCLRCKHSFSVKDLPIVTFTWLARGMQEAHKHCKDKEVKNAPRID